MPTSEETNITTRLVFMGAAGVGKTALIHRLLYDRFELRHRCTVEEVYSLDVDTDLLQVNLEIVDTSGSYSFPAMQKLRIQQGDAFALVYSLADLESFQEVERLREEILRIKGTNSVPIVVVGNQTDRIAGLKSETGKHLAQQTSAIVELQWQNCYTETSAKLNFKVQDIFEELLRSVHQPCTLASTLERRRASTQPEPRKKQLRRKQNCILS